jgi:hypothetical protein
MPRVGFKLTIPTFERAKTVHALDCAAAMIGYVIHAFQKLEGARVLFFFYMHVAADSFFDVINMKRGAAKTEGSFGAVLNIATGE